MAGAADISAISGTRNTLLQHSDEQWKTKAKIKDLRCSLTAVSSRALLRVLRSEPRRTAHKSTTLMVVGTPSIDPNVEIQRFCRMGSLKEAVRTVTSRDLKGSDIDSETYCCVLQLCADLGSLEDGRRVHLVISSSGVQVDTRLGSKLVFMYVKCGDLREGRRVFDPLAEKMNLYTWNLLLNEYAKAGEFEESILLFKMMQDSSSVCPDSYTLSCTLKCFASLGGIHRGKMVHGHLIKLGFEAHCVVGNALVAFYFKCDEVDSAIALFDEMPHRDMVSWNSVISGFVSHGLPRKGLDLFGTMWAGGEDIDSATMVSVLPASAELGYLSLGRVIHGYSVKAGTAGELHVSNSLLDMYSKCFDLDSAVQVFDKMALRSVVSWTALIRAYTRAGLFDEAITLLGEMKQRGIRPDLFAITSIIHACACDGSLDKAKFIHDHVISNGMQGNSFVGNALMDMYAKCGSMDEARSVFDHTVSKDIISWNTMIGGYSRNGLPNEALDLFGKMLLHSKPNSVTMASILPAVASLSCLERGREIHGHIVRTGSSEDKFTMNALLDLYVKCGTLMLARTLFDKMSMKDLISWTVMIAGYAMHGFGEKAVATFKEMQVQGVEPGEVSFAAILDACSHAGLIDEGWKFFDMMKNECKIKPKSEHYVCMVGLLCHARCLTEAYNFIELMPIEPDSSIWGTLLRGCKLHRDAKLAEVVAEKVFELEPENTGNYILLADTYAEAEKWQAVKKHGLGREQGCSWIEIKRNVHVFPSGGRSHPQSKKIARFLEEVGRKMREGAVVPAKRRYALVYAEYAMKDGDSWCGHSEKLAIAFGILNSPKGRPIRVAKNSRMCSECHEVAGFISKMVSRGIIVRDAKRFHHFEGGRCSCRGYW